LRISLTEILTASTRRTSILWRVDNTAALAHIRKEGGLRGKRLLEEAERILLLFHQRQLRIMPAFIPSEENLQADAASRFQLVPDWHLDPRVFRQISSLWGPPQIDLFTSLQSMQTTRFMSWRAADSPEAIDALSMRWDFALAYLFPPIPLLKRVVRVVRSCQGEPFSLSLHIGRPRLGSGVFKRFKSWTSVVSPTTTNSSSTSRRGSLLRL
jgi:hypothetical protein